MRSIILRVVACLAWAVIAAELIQLEVSWYETVDQFSERGLVEKIQALVLLASAVLAFLTAWKCASERPLALMVGLVFGALLIREQDQVLELWFTHGVWKWPAGLLFLAALVIGVTRWKQVYQSLDNFSRSSPFVVMSCGLAVLVFSRLFGRSEMWMAIMGDAYQRVVKNTAEEGLELFALGLMMLGAAEWFLRSGTPSNTDSVE